MIISLLISFNLYILLLFITFIIFQYPLFLFFYSFRLFFYMFLLSFGGKYSYIPLDFTKMLLTFTKD
jgi:hypothetical protein